MQVIYHEIPATSHVSGVYTFAAVMYLKFMAHVMLFPMLNVLYLYISTSRSSVQCTIRLFSAVSRLRAIPDVPRVSESKSDTALYCYLLPHAHISSTKIPSRNVKETGQIVLWLPCRPAGDLASLELGQDFHSERDITGKPHHYRATSCLVHFWKSEANCSRILAPLNNAVTLPAGRRVKKEKKNRLAIKSTNLVAFFHNTLWARLDNTADWCSLQIFWDILNVCLTRKSTHNCQLHSFQFLESFVERENVSGILLVTFRKNIF